jgi:hypothetical protein
VVSLPIEALSQGWPTTRSTPVQERPHWRRRSAVLLRVLRIALVVRLLVHGCSPAKPSVVTCESVMLCSARLRPQIVCVACN